jgi:insertion element IS1 protein InsB
MVIPEVCPDFGSTRYKKNGHTRHGKQHHFCNTCERQFSAGANPHLIAHERRTVVEHLQRERISLRGICHAVGVSLGWLLHFMVECFATCPDYLYVTLPAHLSKVLIHKLESEADAMWSFVAKKANKQWIWVAMDAKTRQIIAFHVGDRRRESAKALWAIIPEVYHQHATFYTDQYDVYNGVMSAERQKAITKKARKTNHEATSFPPRARHVVILQEGREPHRFHHVFHLPLQPGESGNIPFIALPAAGRDGIPHEPGTLLSSPLSEYENVRCRWERIRWLACARPKEVSTGKGATCTDIFTGGTGSGIHQMVARKALVTEEPLA